MNILAMISCTVVGVIIYYFFKPYVFSRIKINKWFIILAILLTGLISAFIPVSAFLIYLLQGIYVVLILLFVDVYTYSKKSKLQDKKNSNNK